jgi:hypothetical protein
MQFEYRLAKMRLKVFLSFNVLMELFLKSDFLGRIFPLFSQVNSRSHSVEFYVLSNMVVVYSLGEPQNDPLVVDLECILRINEVQSLHVIVEKKL